MSVSQSECGTAIPTVGVEQQQPLEVVVLFTDFASTLGALRTASQLARGLDVRIRLLAHHCVPYPLAVDNPPIDSEVLTRQVRACLETQSEGTVAAEVVLCRDVWQAVHAKLLPRSVIVIGMRGGWWKPEERLAKRLRAAGHHVVRTSGLEKGRTGWTRFMSVLGYFSSRSAGRW